MDNKTAYLIVRYKQIGEEMNGVGWDAIETKKAKRLAETHVARRVGTCHNAVGINSLIDQCKHFAFVDDDTVYDIREKQ